MKSQNFLLTRDFLSENTGFEDFPGHIPEQIRNPKTQG